MLAHRASPTTRPRTLAFVLPLSLLVLACDADHAEGTATQAPPAQEQATADLIIYGGAVHTGRAGAQRAEAVAVEDGLIVYVGDADGALALGAPAATRIDLQGRVLFPGFVDAHAHLIGVGLREITLNLDDVASLQELTERVAGEVAPVAPGAVIQGRGWIETFWPEDRMPTRADLDVVAPDNPVLLIRADGHALVANTAAFRAAAVPSDVADPDGGQFVRDADGAFTGIVIDTAMNAFAGLMSEPEGAARDAALQAGAQVYAALGWTGMHNMSVAYDGDGGDVARLERLDDAGELPIRLYNAVSVDGADALLATGARQSASGRVVTRAIKLYTDGALGSRGAALLEPYADAPGRGLLLMRKELADDVFGRARDAGLQLAVHAIGDRANRLALDWMEESLAVPAGDGAKRDPRWRIEHAQIIDPADIPRFGALGIIPSMQPSHAIGDLHFAPDRLGLERLDGAYAWKSLIETGAVIAGGSDAPVERGDPMIEFYAAVARKDMTGFSGDGWGPDQALDRATALKLFTEWPAYAAFQETQLGLIEVGKRADFSVFTGDIMAVPEAELLTLDAWLTVVDGRVVYRAE